MDFLTKLYSNDNFGIILFTSISILVLAFLIILFFGKKDQKERKLAETKILNTNTNEEKKEKEEVAFAENTPRTELNVYPTSENNTIPEVPLPFNMETPKVVPEPMNIVKGTKDPFTTTGPIPLPPQNDFDFDALAESISKELESIGVSADNIENQPPVAPIIEPEIKPVPPIKVEPIIKEKTPEPIFKQEDPRPIEPIIKPTEQPTLNIEPTIMKTIDNPNPIKFETPKEPERPITPIREKTVRPAEEKIKMPSPTQFSSVFVNKKKEQNNIETPIMEPIKSVEPKRIEETPAKPTIELPKTIDLPKLNTGTETKEESIPNISFKSLEEDIPTYENNNENRM